MMLIETPDIRSPFPTFGELFRILAKAFDVDQTQAREIGRLVRDGDYDWSIALKVWDEIFSKHLTNYIDQEFSDCLIGFGQMKYDDYKNLVLNTQVDALNRRELAFFLQDELASTIYFFLKGFEYDWDSPDLKLFTSPESNSFKVVFEWIQNVIHVQVDLIKYVYPDATNQKTLRRNFERGCRGEHVPDLSSLKLFSNELSDRLKENKYDDEKRIKLIKTLKTWLFFARILEFLNGQVAVYDIDLKKLLQGYIDNEVVPDPLFMFHYCLNRKDTIFDNINSEELFQELLDNNIEPNAWVLFSYCVGSKNFEAGRRLFALQEPRDEMLKALNRNEYFTDDAQKKNLTHQLDGLKEHFQVHDPDGRARYELERLYGRFYLLCGDFKQAVLHYDEVIQLILYRGGQAIKPIFEEVLYFYAHIENIVKLKQLRHRGIALGLLKKPVEDQTINFTDEELDGLKNKFFFKFPNVARLKYAQK